MNELFKHVKFQYILAILVTMLCFGMLFYIISSHFPKDLINHAGDIKIGCIQILTAIVMYYFGSSMHSQKKDDTVNTLANNQTSNNEKAV